MCYNHHIEEKRDTAYQVTPQNCISVSNPGIFNNTELCSTEQIRNQKCSAPTFFLHQSERFCIPAVIDVGWLYIKVTVDAHCLLAWV